MRSYNGNLEKRNETWRGVGLAKTNTRVVPMISLVLPDAKMLHLAMTDTENVTTRQLNSSHATDYMYIS